MNIDLTEILLFAAVWFLASIVASKQAEHTADVTLKRIADLTSIALLIVGAAFTVWACVRV